MEIIYLIIGLVIGCACVYLVMAAQKKSVIYLLEAERTAKNEAKKEGQEAVALVKAEATQTIEKQKTEWVRALEIQKLEGVQALEAQKAENERQRNKELQDLKQNYQQQIELFKAQLGNLGERMIRERSEELQNANKVQMETLLGPLNENLKRMEEAVKDTNINSARNTASLKTSIQQMMEQTMALGREADRLSNALQQNNKIAGNWGELILAQLLESQGLKKGLHFDEQETLRDEKGEAIRNEDSGRRMIPDVILHLADNRDVIIDSKMSLKAFIDYQNAEDEEGKEEAAKRHLDSVWSHVKELSKKDYSKYLPKNRAYVDFVIMFVPIEGALQLAMAKRPELWRDAFDNKVLITGAQTLMAGLRIIDLTWVNVQQQTNTQKILDEARKMIDRTSAFYEKYLTLGKKIEDVQNIYKETKERAIGEGQSILRTAIKLQDLGVRGKKSLPDVFPD